MSKRHTEKRDCTGRPTGTTGLCGARIPDHQPTEGDPCERCAHIERNAAEKRAKKAASK